MQLQTRIGRPRPAFAGSLPFFLLLLLALFIAACHRQNETVSGTIEVDEVHVAPRMGGRIQKIFVREGDALNSGQLIVELDAAELPAQRDLARAQVDAASRDVESQQAQFEFLRSDAKRQQELLRN
ncbi:MAG TPA: biotin/lipoyl-binding protein, partial [Chthoniobacterales bacterium]|nr:biotin/lipoyl-binding protein [Chthoniobacterales bacterium]